MEVVTCMASYTVNISSFPGLKRRGRGVNQPPKSSAEVKELVELCLYSPSEPSWQVIRWTLPLLLLVWLVLTAERWWMIILLCRPRLRSYVGYFQIFNHKYSVVICKCGWIKCGCLLYNREMARGCEVWGSDRNVDEYSRPWTVWHRTRRHCASSKRRNSLTFQKDWSFMVKERVSKRREVNGRWVVAVALPTKSNGREYNGNFACTWPQEVRLPCHVVTQSVYWKMAGRPAYCASQSCSKNMVVLQLFLRWACTRNFIRNKSALLSVGPCLSVAY